MRTFKAGDTLIRNRDILATDLDQETVLMSIDAGAYYGLEETAQTIWSMLETPLTFSDLVDQLVKTYNVTHDECAADLQQFLGAMEQEGLLRVE